MIKEFDSADYMACDCYYLSNGELWVEKIERDKFTPTGLCTLELHWRWDEVQQLLVHKLAHDSFDNFWSPGGEEYQRAYHEYITKRVARVIEVE